MTTSTAVAPTHQSSGEDVLLDDFLMNVLPDQWMQLDGIGCSVVSAAGNRFDTISLEIDYRAEDYCDIEKVVTRFPDGRMFLWKVRVGKTPSVDTCELVDDFEPMLVESCIQTQVKTIFVPASPVQTEPLF